MFNLFLCSKLKMKWIIQISKNFTFVLLLLFSFLAIFSCSFDCHLLIYGSESKFSSIGEFWYELSPSSIQISEVIVSRYIDPCSQFVSLNCNPFLWHPFVSSILIMPSTPTFLLFSIICLYFYKKLKRSENYYYFK